MSIKHKFYFTFGQSHYDNEGRPLKNYYVEVHSTSYDNARNCFLNRFASHYLPKPDQWSFQYAEEDFNANYFPFGRYMLIEDIVSFEKQEVS